VVTVTPLPPTANVSSPINTLEFVDRTTLQNCYDHGDGFCDTEADPYPSALPACYSNNYHELYETGLKDGKGNFTHRGNNYMSNVKLPCRFSQEQYNYMAYIIMTRRIYLH